MLKMETVLKIPAIATVGTLESNHIQTILTFHQPQIIEHMAFIPIESQRIDESLLDTIGLIEEFKLEQDLIITEGLGGYDNAQYLNKSGKTVIVPPGTHLKGGHQNRGNNFTEVLEDSTNRKIDVNCFEPSRGHGDTDHFLSFEDAPADVIKTTMTDRQGYNGSWDNIAKYTSLIEGHNRALTAFNDATESERMKYALNFETMCGQTGYAIITEEMSLLEIFPTPNTFNIYRERVLRGKVASLFYRLMKEEEKVILPSTVEKKLNGILKVTEKAIDTTVEKGEVKQNLRYYRHRQNNIGVDTIITSQMPQQIAYVCGVW